MNKINSKDNGRSASSRLVCVSLLKPSIQQLNSNSSVRLAQSEDDERGSRCVILRTGH